MGTTITRVKDEVMVTTMAREMPRLNPNQDTMAITITRDMDIEVMVVTTMAREMPRLNPNQDTMVITITRDMDIEMPSPSNSSDSLWSSAGMNQNILYF